MKCIFPLSIVDDVCPNCGSTLMSFDGKHCLCAPCAAREIERLRQQVARLKRAKFKVTAQQCVHPTGLTAAQKEEVRQMIQSALDTGSA
jgi:hypothetical protein